MASSGPNVAIRHFGLILERDEWQELAPPARLRRQARKNDTEPGYRYVRRV
jgi:extradiol dioxygenase family protein